MEIRYAPDSSDTAVRFSPVAVWVTLTVAGLAMGLIIFVIASGLTLVFGLMDVLNFGHGVFIALGAFIAGMLIAASAGLGAASGSCDRLPRRKTGGPSSAASRVRRPVRRSGATLAPRRSR